MKISATIKNAFQKNEISVCTENNAKSIGINPKTEGFGSSVNDGELLFLSLATCFCNDLYREAAKRNMTIDHVEVTVSGQFGGEGEPASNISYSANVDANQHSKTEIAELIEYVDSIAEIHKTLRQGIPIELKK